MARLELITISVTGVPFRHQGRTSEIFFSPLLLCTSPYLLLLVQHGRQGRRRPELRHIVRLPAAFRPFCVPGRCHHLPIALPSQPFPASEAGKAFSPRFRAQAAGYDERNPPPHDTAPEGREAARALNRCLHPMNDELPGDLGPPKPIDTSERDGVPAFLDRRKANGKAEPSFVDLVEG